MRNGSSNPDSGSNGGTLQFGGGLDLRTPLSVPFLKIPLGLRVEARDYYAARPNYRVGVTGGLQHNVIVAAGIVLRR